MKGQIELLIAQHKLFKQQAEIELEAELQKVLYSQLCVKPKLRKEIEMKTLFISELT
jgi:hypothetical protein